MLQTKLKELLSKYHPSVQSVVQKVLLAERAKLSYRNPRDIKKDIRDIIEEEASRIEANQSSAI